MNNSTLNKIEAAAKTSSITYDQIYQLINEIRRLKMLNGLYAFDTSDKEYKSELIEYEIAKEALDEV